MTLLISTGSEDERDPDWTPDDFSDNEISDKDTNDAFEEIEMNEAMEKKFIVFESWLDLLLESCSLCGKNSIRKKVIGTGLAVTTMCYTCGDKSNWSSQLMSGALPFGNLFCLLQLCFVVQVQLNEGWSDGAKVQGKLPVPGRPTIWMTVGQGPTALAVGAGGACLDIFTLIYPLFPLSPSLWETARYILKYCLNGPLNPKQPTNQIQLMFACPRLCWNRKHTYKYLQ